ncbi:hypothetical protein A2803_02675 [Candidatus Woesebacteria bacterium RIFCSPHIGHO2_01_FULL_44_21]|uniref:DDH domain-containing protein n=1 Tax=Candidatus Woesebacteria bacterium RIFCSPHIGHO2_01_FULL_44_21 TaxID=1802503 RepID=A0A1F7YYJ8_9BACT|nr:MAG: hypothetical protein A2803_02675 [Candidatus Woesebacteria bacterium RIFCSPHIGHO2_01_FULL_44_21]OGM69823.1 MAG: hypothetical protein A2897_00570 [Candidatus Woesebacteria bacterium RIFCSPLOWO2_01_FULL_44_24b]
MNYPESQAIKQKIDSSQKILVNMHHNSDADSVGSAVAMARVLKYFKKDVKIIAPTEIPKNLEFLLTEQAVNVVNFSEFDFSIYDLFITLDSSSFSRVAGSHSVKQPELSLINIDHHVSNQKFGEINLVVPDAAANCEVLFYLFKDWGVEIKDAEEALLTGIIGDTGAFRFPEAGGSTFEAASQLMKFADKNKIIFNLYQSFEENHVMVWKGILDNLKIDHEHRFVYSFVRKEVLEKYGKPFNAKSELADMIFQSIEGTDFGLVGAEDEGYISVSFRSRTGVDVSRLAGMLGGGGHAWAAAARVDVVNYDNAVEQILGEAREFAKGGSTKP